MVLIRLSRGEWSYDPTMPLGPEGGFGVVYAGEGKDVGPVAVKRLKVSAANMAHRELRIAAELAGVSLAHVIPVYDAGEDAESGSYFVVMARADGSLQDEIRGARTFDDTEAADVLLQIALGLSEVEQLVHRDLKPGNVLLHKGIWKVADFGIARFVEESTSARTLKECLSPPYAAPEQWRLERATGPTDVYALGCIGYALLTGQPPFSGPLHEDYKRQHQHEEPPSLDGHDARFRSLLVMMLRKTPAARPGIDRVMTILNRTTAPDNSGGAFSALAEAGADVAERERANEVLQTAAESSKVRRDQMTADAVRLLATMIDDLIDRIIAVAPSARRTSDGLGVRLGDAELRVFLHARTLPDNAFAESMWDVVTGATIVVQQANPRYKWSASLWYARLKPDQDYRWYEVSYFSLASSKRLENEFVPFALTDELRHADEAAARGSSMFRIAFGPKPIDDEDSNDFCKRWAGLLADAAQGRMSYPRYLPLQ